MSRWFRHYAGMMRDDKLVRVAIRSKQTIERVVWVWGAILESAAEIDDAGRYDVDASEIAYFLRADQADVDSILAGLADAGRVDSGSVVKWSNRQFASDRSRDRVAAHRERKRTEEVQHPYQQTSQDGDVTLQKRHCDAPETDTEAETEPSPAKAVEGTRKRASSTKIEIPDWMPGEEWQAFVEMRRAIPKVPFTVKAARDIIAELGRIRDEGYDIAPVLMNSVRNGYRDVFKPKTPPPRKAAEPADPIKFSESLDNRAALYRKIGREDDAIDAERQAARIRGPTTIGSLVRNIQTGVGQ